MAHRTQAYQGLVVWSFALRAEEPSPCNRRLAAEVWRIVLEEEKSGRRVLIVAQCGVAEALKNLHMPLAYVVERHHIAGAYLDSREVMAQAVDVFRQYGVREVIPIANPFVHLRHCRSLVRKWGFIPLESAKSDGSDLIRIRFSGGRAARRVVRCTRRGAHVGQFL